MKGTLIVGAGVSVLAAAFFAAYAIAAVIDSIANAGWAVWGFFGFSLLAMVCATGANE